MKQKKVILNCLSLLSLLFTSSLLVSCGDSNERYASRAEVYDICKSALKTEYVESNLNVLESLGNFTFSYSLDINDSSTKTEAKRTISDKVEYSNNKITKSIYEYSFSSSSSTTRKEYIEQGSYYTYSKEDDKEETKKLELTDTEMTNLIVSRYSYFINMFTSTTFKKLFTTSFVISDEDAKSNSYVLTSDVNSYEYYYMAGLNLKGLAREPFNENNSSCYIEIKNNKVNKIEFKVPYITVQSLNLSKAYFFNVSLVHQNNKISKPSWANNIN